jgi:signal peptidase I
MWWRGNSARNTDTQVLELLKTNGSLCIQAFGQRMFPFIQDGDFIRIKPVEVNKIKKGDILFCYLSDQLVAHRLVKKISKNGETFFVTKADSGISLNAPIQPKDILGKVVSIKRKEQVRDLNRGLVRLAGLLLASFWPLVRMVCIFIETSKELLSEVIKWTQGFRFYRYLAKRLLLRNISYQVATPEDAFLLLKFYRYNPYPYALEPLLSVKDHIQHIQRQGCWLIAKKGNRVIGVITLVEFKLNKSAYAGWWIYGLAVRLLYRRLGIGKRLCKMAFEEAVRKGAKQVKLFARENSKAGIGFYKKLGFSQISIPEIDYELKENIRRGLPKEIIMVKHLSSS